MNENQGKPELIRVVQLPVIEEQLRAMKEQVDQKVADALSLVCTDDTLSAVKEVRASLNKDFKALEEQRKAVKKAVMGPYEAFEKVYKECVSDAFNRADYELKGKISDVENAIKGACEQEMRSYFSELASAEHVEWLTWDRLGLKIDLTSARQKSHAKLREQIAAFVVRVSQDVTTISGMEDAEEIMAEYRQYLDMGQAIGIVQDRHKRIEEERQAAEARRVAQEAQQAAVEKVEAVTPTTVLEPPMAASATQQEDEKVYKCSFTVRATKAQLKQLKEFMIREGIRYE